MNKKESDKMDFLLTTAWNNIYNGLNDSEKRYVDYLHEYRSREELCYTFNMNDRAIRKLNEKLRTKGVPIVSSPHRKGYALGNPIDVYNTYANQVKPMLQIMRVFKNINLQQGAFCEDSEVLENI